MHLFLNLMANRKSTPISKEWVDSLNQIDVVFQDNPKVRKAWLSFFDSLHPKSQHFENKNSFQLDLLSEIANSLNYKKLKQTEIDRFYNPQAFEDKESQKELITKETIRILKQTKSFGESLNEE